MSLLDSVENSRMPEFEKDAFHCPLCGVYAHQEWAGDFVSNRAWNIFEVHISVCRNCHQACLWVNRKLIFPDIGNAPRPHPDMPASVKPDYEEAAAILQKSPRAAAALLRLALENLCECKEVGAKGKTLQEKIDFLIKEKVLSPRLAKVMDAIRVIGNEAVHPGVLDLHDDTKTVNTMFGLINFIVEELITKPAAIDSFYKSAVPDSKKRKNMPQEENQNAGK